ncbi:MAG: hypothetical protein ACPG61_10175 [Paracoccaceae bacterium]
MGRLDQTDPKGLIRESYQIEGISAPECRSIFLDWALSLPEAENSKTAIQALLDQYGTDAPDHPMTTVLQDGLTTIATPRRRGGWRSRTRN